MWNLKGLRFLGVLIVLAILSNVAACAPPPATEVEESPVIAEATEVIAEEQPTETPTPALSDQAKQLYESGVAAYQAGDMQKALTDLTQAIESAPEYMEAYYERGLVHMELGNIQQALDDFSKVVEFDPEHSEALYHRGVAHFATGKYEEAMKDFDTALAIDPELAQVYFDRGTLYLAMDDIESAIADFQKYVQIAPDGPDKELVLEIIADLEMILNPPPDEAGE